MSDNPKDLKYHLMVRLARVMELKNKIERDREEAESFGLELVKNALEGALDEIATEIAEIEDRIKRNDEKLKQA